MKSLPSFYHWKSSFEIDSTETEVMQNNNCQTLYVKYFDVVVEDGHIKPVSVVTFKTRPVLNVVPVVYIKNNVFSLLDSAGVDSLAINVYKLCNQVNHLNTLEVKEMQFDCDWTDKTTAAYFHFLRKFRNVSGLKLSSTIRLHQVKYKTRTGIPPVDKGVLMYYNMGSINAGQVNSIYNRSNALKYVSWLKSYPLKLDIALPVFGWGIQLTDKKVINLLNKTDETDFTKDTNFVLNQGKIIVKNACFKAGYYYSKNDCIKFEQITAGQLYEMAEDIKEYIKEQPAEIIFYDLDTINLKRYDKTIYKKVADSFN